MSEPKPFASLSSGLLARKGMAKPAMRPQGFGQASAGLDDLGWNDMGHAARPQPPVPSPYEAPHEDHVPSRISALTPMNAGDDGEEDFEPAPPVVEQQRAAIAASFSEPREPHSVLAVKTKKADEPEETPELDELELDEAVEEPWAEQVAEPEPAEPVFERSAPRAESRSAQPRQASARAKGKAAFTLRLEAERHLKLRLACAVTGRSAQQLVTEALDQLLQSKPEVEALAEQVPGKARKPD